MVYRVFMEVHWLDVMLVVVAMVKFVMRILIVMSVMVCHLVSILRIMMLTFMGMHIGVVMNVTEVRVLIFSVFIAIMVTAS